MAQTDSQYPWKLCLINCELDSDVYNFENWLLLSLFLFKIARAFLLKENVSELDAL